MNLLVPRPSGILLSYSTSLQKDDRWEAEGPSLPWCAMHPGEKLKMSERLSLFVSNKYAPHSLRNSGVYWLRNTSTTDTPRYEVIVELR